MVVIALLGAAVVGSLVLAGLVRLERTGRRHVIFAMLVALLLVEALLNPSEQNVPKGLFRQSIGGYDVRPGDAFIALALMARFLGGGHVRRISAAAAAWVAYIVWFAGAAMAGVLYRNSPSQLVFQARSMYYVGGAMVLAQGIDYRRLVRRKTFGHWAAVLGACGAFVLAAGLAGFVFHVYAGPLKLPTVGRINNDTISLLLGAGAVLALVEATRVKRRLWIAFAAILCLAGPFSGTQRANYLALAGTLVVLGVATLSRPWRRRVKTTPTEALGLLGVMALAGISMFTFGGNQVNVVAKVDDTFFGSTEQATTDSRLSLWSEGWKRIQAKPAFGWGLGIRDSVQMRGFATEAQLTSHNIVLDVTTRTGVIGLALIAVALALTFKTAWFVWREHPDDQLAALSVAMASMVSGFLGKGMVESTFEKFRLSIGLGIAVGVILALGAQLRALQAGDNDLAHPEQLLPDGRVPAEV